MTTETDRCGISRTSALVVVACIGILLALLVPAIQSAREAARRTQSRGCQFPPLAEIARIWDPK
jgi:hypothetical protein